MRTENRSTAGRRSALAWAIFAGLAVLAPLPIAIFDGLVPLARLLLLAVVSSLVAITEGSGGPVGLITLVFIGHVVVYTTTLAIAARLIAAALQRILADRAMPVVLLAIAMAIVFALATTPYSTPFAPLPHSNLVGVLS